MVCPTDRLEISLLAVLKGRITMISVIVPIHNGEKTLSKCVDSILDSTVSDIEIILVENGSTDRTINICQDYSRKYETIRTLVADKVGLSHARNLGMKAASGEWIAFVDADDYISPVMYESLIRKAAHDHNDFVFGDIETGSAESYVFLEKIPDSAYKNVSKQDYAYSLFCVAQYHYSIVVNKLFSAEMLRDAYFSEDLWYAEDREFIFRVLSRANSIGYVAAPIYYYYQGNPSCISKSSSMEKRMDQVHSLQKCLTFADDVFAEEAQYGDYVNACLLQNADFRRRRAIECNLPAQIAELDPIIRQAAKRLRQSKHLDARTKYRFLLEHDSPKLFSILAKIMRKC